MSPKKVFFEESGVERKSGGQIAALELLGKLLPNKKRINVAGQIHSDGVYHDITVYDTPVGPVTSEQREKNGRWTFTIRWPNGLKLRGKK